MPGRGTKTFFRVPRGEGPRGSRRRETVEPDPRTTTMENSNTCQSLRSSGDRQPCLETRRFCFHVGLGLGRARPAGASHTQPEAPSMPRPGQSRHRAGPRDPGRRPGTACLGPGQLSRLGDADRRGSFSRRTTHTPHVVSRRTEQRQARARGRRGEETRAR